MRKLAMAAILSTTAMYTFANAQTTIRVEKITIKEKQKKEEVSKKETTQEDVKITRQIDLGEILSGIYPEVNFMRKAGTANDLNIRGFSRDNINVFIDGSEVHGACPNRMDPPSFHVSSPQIEKIEIKEGPFDVENPGTLAAVVNVKTKDPKEGVGGDMGVTVGSFSYRTGYFWGDVGNKFMKVLVGASNQYSKPYESGEGKKVTEYAVYTTQAGPTAGKYKPQYINEKAFNIDRVWSKVVLTPTDNVEFKLSYAFENARNILYPALKMDALYDRTNKLNADFNIKDLGLKISAYQNKVKHDMRDTFRTTSGTAAYSMMTYAESSMTGFKVVKSFGLGWMDADVGADYYLRNWKADNIQGANTSNPNRNPGMIPDVDIKNVGFFVKGIRDIQSWTISAGLRFDSTKSEADKNKISGNNSALIPLLSSFSKTDSYPSGYILAKYNIDKRNNLYIGFGHSVRVPDPIERYIALSGQAPWYGNPSLKPTKNNEIDVGAELYPIDNLGLRANLFYSDLTDFIYLRQYPNTCLSGTGTCTYTTYQNIDAKIYGGDLSLFYGFNEKLSAEVGLAYQRGKKDSGVYNDGDLAEIPPLKSRVALKYDDGAFYGLIEGIYQARQSKVDSDLKEIETSSYFIMNLKVGYTYANRLFFGLGVDNVFDRLYYNYLSYVRDPFRGISVSGNPVKIPEPGRFIYANLSYRF